MTENRNLLDVVELILKSAVFITERRGGKSRLDYPKTEPKLPVLSLDKNQEWVMCDGE